MTLRLVLKTHPGMSICSLIKCINACIHVSGVRVQRMSDLRISLRVFFVILAISTAAARKEYQSNIPNGDIVSHPCKVNYIWHGVGHRRAAGGGYLNPFGEAFKKAGYEWTKELCMLDSDGDGVSNGMELGDPVCVWSKGHIPARTTNITHPGVCEPWNSPSCAGKQEWMVEACQPDQFVCDGLKDPDLRNFTVRFNNTQVPAKETTYMCKIFEVDEPGEFHLIATQPMIDNEYVMHHIVLFGCLDDPRVQTTPEPYQCGMSPHKLCFNILSVWTLGSAGDCIHRNLGFKLGDNGGYKKLAIQYHYNNPSMNPNYRDSTGMVLHYTPNLRPNNAGILLVGTEFLEIPPRRDRLETTSICPASCTKRDMKGSVYVASAFNHMHYMGIAQKIEILRNGERVTYLTNDNVYNYDSPKIYNFDDPVLLLPGDEIKTTCAYKSTTRDMTTYFGEGTSDEMCYGFLTFYPSENMTRHFCRTWKSLETCMGPPYNGCTDMYKFYNNFEKTDLYLNITSKCNFHESCREECLEQMTEAKKDPCLSGDVWDMLVHYTLKHTAPGIHFLGALESCQLEFHDLQNKGTTPQCETEGPTSSASNTVTTWIRFIMVALVVIERALF